MDWASAEWKQALTPLAVQKVGALEEKIEKLQKDRQQKQLQFECLELALEKEKRKTEREKQYSSEIQRELQSLADTCKDFENKQQKLQNELQNRDSRIKNLEALLSQSRKESSKLQQLESDLKDLSYVREDAISVREQKLQKKLHLFEQSVVTQEQNSNMSMTRDSSSIGYDITEQTSNNLMDNSAIERSLKQKIEEQEELIKELRTQLDSVSRNAEIHDSSNVFKTPAKSVSVTDSPAIDSKNSWNIFSSTPAKGNKSRILGHGDSTSIDSGNEKLLALQSRLKQLGQELDCQRHNFEASKNALELKYKESESTLKADLKYQIQANTELDKELKDSKNKYQQELSQTTKKLDMLTLQLKKSEEAKAAYERNLKSLESRINMNESTLKLKEEELRELQKSKIACDSTQQALQSKIRELEKNCRVLTEKNGSLSENVKATLMQLEGSNNLVKEKEISLHNAQQDMTNLKLRMKELENNFTAQEAKLKESQVNETLIAEQLEFLAQEKKELNDSLNSEIKKNQNAESNMEEKEQSILLLKEELNKNTLSTDELRSQMVILNNEYQVKLAELENKFHNLKQEHDALQNESGFTEVILKEKIKQLEESNKNLSDDIGSEKDINDSLKSNLEQETWKRQSIEEELTSKSLKLEELQNEMNISINELKVKLEELENKIHISKQEYDALQNEGTLTETSLKQKIEELEKSNKELSDIIAVEEHKNDSLKLNLEKDTQKMLSLEDDLASKCLKIEELQNQINISRNKFENEIEEVNAILKSSNEKVMSLESELSTFSTNENTLNEKLELMEEEKSELNNQLLLETSKIQQLELCIEKEKQDSSLWNEKFVNKCAEFEDLMKAVKEEHETNKHKLEQELCEVSLKEASLIAKIEQMEGLNKELSCNIDVEKNKSECLKFNLEEETLKIASLKEELASKCKALEDLQNETKISRNQLENEIKELNNTLNSSQARITSLETELNAVSIDTNVKEKLKQSDEEKLELSNHLKLMISEVKQLELCYKKEKEVSSSLKGKFDMKCLEFEDFANSVKVSNDEYKTKIEELVSTLNSSQDKISSLESEIKTFSSSENDLKEKLVLIEKEKLELCNQINLETTKVQQLELCIEKGKEDFSLMKEQFENKCVELDKVKYQVTVLKECEANSNEIKQKFHAAIEQLGKSQNQLHESSLMELSLKDQITHLQESNKQLSDDLSAESNNAKCLQFNLQEESLKILSLNENLSSKSLELEELQSEILCLKNQYESDIQALEAELNTATSNANTTENQLKSTEQEKLAFFEQLQLEILKVQELKSCLEDERQANCLLKENLENSCVQCEELSNHMKNMSTMYEAKDHELQEKFSSVEAKSMLLESQFKEYSMDKISAEEKFDLAEKEKKELLNQLTCAATQIQKLELSIEEERQVSFMLKEEIAKYHLEFQKLNDQIKNLNEVHEARELDFETRFSSAEAKSMVLETQLKEMCLNKISTKENVDAVDNEKIELLGKIAFAATKIQELEACIENEKQAFSILKEDLEKKCVENKDLNSQMEILKEEQKIIMHELEEKLHATKQEHSTSQKQLHESSLMEASLKEQLEQLESLNNEISYNLKTESDQNKCLHLNLHEASQEILTLKEELSSNSLEVEKLTNQMLISKTQFENQIQTLEDALNSSKLRISSLEVEMKGELSKENSVKEKLDLAKQENSELCLQLKLETAKVQRLESDIQKAAETYLVLEEEFENRCLGSANLNRKIKDYEKTLSDIKQKLSCLEVEKVSLEHEKDQLADHLKTETDKCQSLQLSLINWRAFVISLDESLCHLACKEQTVAKEMSDSKKYYEDKIEKLENELELAQLAYTTLESERGESTCDDMKLKQQLDIFVMEKKNLTSEVAEVANKYLQFEMTIQEQQIKMQELEEKLSHLETHSATLELKLKESCQIEVSLKEELSQVEDETLILQDILYARTDEVKTLNTCIENIRKELSSTEEKLSLKSDKLKELHDKGEVIKEYENKIQDLENRLLAAQTQQTDFENQLQACALKEESLTASLAVIEKEKLEVNEKLNAECGKSEELLLFVQQLTESCESFEEEQSRKTLLLGEANTLKYEFQNKIRDLYADFQNHLQECSMNEKNLKNSLTVLEKENEEMSEKLTAEYLKTEKLEFCVEELEKAIISSTKQLEKVTRLSNDSPRTIPNLQYGMSDAQSENVFWENELKGYLANEQLLKKRLDTVEKEKQVIHNQLSVEASKIRILETGVGELKRMIMALQVMLLCNNDDTNWAYGRKSTLKELYKDISCGADVQSPDKINLKSATPKKSKLSLDLTPIKYSAVTSKTVDFDEMAMTRSYKKLEYSEDLHKFSLRFLKEIHSLEEDLFAKIEFLKFVYSYKLFEKKKLSCLWKKCLFLIKQLQMIQTVKKFMSCVCNILKSNVVSCKFDHGKTNPSALLSEKLNLSTQDIFYLCGDTLNKVLFSVSQTLQQSKIDIKQCCLYKYSTVQSNMLSVNTSTKFLIFLHHLSRSYINSDLRLCKSNPCLKIDVQNAQKILAVLKVQDLPFFINYVVALTEYIEKICSRTDTILQSHAPMPNLPIYLPLPHIFKQYHLNCLDTDNDNILDELKYWRKYCSVLGISEWDIEKIIPLFECKTKNITPSEATKDLSVEIYLLKEECGALQNAILAEKEKQKLLNETIEEIEQDLGDTFQQKEKYMNMVLKISKVLVKLKENIGAANGFNMIELENDLSDDSCYCEMCILQEESEEGPHEKLLLLDLFVCIKKLVESGSEVETKLLKFSQQQADLTTMYKELQDRNSELEMALASFNVGSKDTRNEIENLRYELMKEKENYQRICQTADQKDSLILELETTTSNLSTANEIYKAKLGDYEEESLKLSADLEELSAALSSKEKEVDFLKRTMEEESLTFQNVQLQCKEYENKIQLLNSTISKFEEEKALDKHSFSDKNQKTISELQDKIESLKKANDSLNLTIETIEEELKKAYSEKQDVEQLEKLTLQNIQLKDEATNATQKYICEQQANKVLLSDLNKLELLKVSSDNTVNNLKKKNEILDKDVNLLKCALRNHEQNILEKNSSLKLKDQAIDRLKLKISETEQENLDLNMRLEENIATLRLQINEVTEQCRILEEKNKDLEVQTSVLLQNIDEVKLQRDSLLKDANVLRTELEDAHEQCLHHETTHKELVLKHKETCEVLNKEITLKNSLEKQLSNNQNTINDLDNRFQILNTTTEQFKLLNSKKEEENMVLVQKVKDLEKEIQIAKNSLTESYQKQEAALVEYKESFEKLGEVQNPVVQMSDFHNLKTVCTDAIQFIINILNITIDSIKSNSRSEAQKLKSSLLSALHYWKQCSETEPKTQNTFNEIFDDLRYFYGTLSNKCDEEQAVHGHVKSIMYTLSCIGQFCDSSARNYQTSNYANMTNMSMFETTENFSVLAQVNHSPSVLITELQQVKKLLDEYFSHMRSTISKQEEEIEMFKAKLTEMSTKQVSSGAECVEADKGSYKWKYHLMKVNNQKLEKEYNKLGKDYHELEDHIKILEKEKQSLEEEAEELANDFKKIEDQLYNSNELAEALTRLVHTQEKLKETEKESNWLKQKLEYCRSNHGKKAILAPSEGASNVLSATEHKENVKKGNDKFIS